jgi:hypothetical protein
MAFALAPQAPGKLKKIPKGMTRPLFYRATRCCANPSSLPSIKPNSTLEYILVLFAVFG